MILGIILLILLTFSFEVLERLKKNHHEEETDETKNREGNEQKYTQLRLTEINTEDNN